MSSDRELLDLAAKAAGFKLLWSSIEDADLSPRLAGSFDIWNPLTDDGDALRLAVKLRLEVYIHENDTRVIDGNLTSASSEVHFDDPFAATRRAIVLAAAEIGRAL